MATIWAVLSELERSNKITESLRRQLVEGPDPMTLAFAKNVSEAAEHRRVLESTLARQLADLHRGADPDPTTLAFAKNLIEAAERHREAVALVSQQIEFIQSAIQADSFTSATDKIMAHAVFPPSAEPFNNAVQEMFQTKHRPEVPNPALIQAILGRDQRLPPSWPSALAGIAVDAAADQLAELDADSREEIERVIGEELREAARTQDTVDEGSATAQTLTPAAQQDELAVLAIAIWKRVIARLRPKETTAHLLLGMIWSLLLVLYQERSGAAEHAQVLAAALQAQEKVTTELRDEMRRLARQASNPPARQLVAVKDVPVRENPDSTAKRIGTIAAGSVVLVREQVERWLYVETETEGHSPAAVEGWVYYRNLRPAPR